MRVEARFEQGEVALPTFVPADLPVEETGP
jgi:hypothetical protein